MPKDEKRQAMLDWFHANYEDPVNRLPYESAEGGCQWRYGGPYDAEEDIREVFESFVSQAMIEEVVEELQSDGLYEWAPTPRREDYDDTSHPPGFDPLNGVPDELGPLFGSAEEVAVRKRAIGALKEVESALRTSSAVGIGHNQPPGDDVQYQEASDLRTTATELREELEKPRPQIPIAKALLRSLGRRVSVVGRWVGRKLDVMADEAGKNMVRAAVVAPVLATEPNIQAAVQNAFDLVKHWRHLATSGL